MMKTLELLPQPDDDNSNNNNISIPRYYSIGYQLQCNIFRLIFRLITSTTDFL